MRITPYVLLPLLFVACSESSGPDDLCNTASLPLDGTGEGPVIVDVGLEVQPGGIVVLATATDPQGDPNLFNVVQTVGVFPDSRCEGTAITIQDDLAGSGLEESFGTAVDATTAATLYGRIAAATSWPVTVDFLDVDGNRTTGRVMADVR
jgi:hypothetical protein